MSIRDDLVIARFTLLESGSSNYSISNHVIIGFSIQRFISNYRAVATSVT
jgi:hypothetical protein